MRKVYLVLSMLFLVSAAWGQTLYDSYTDGDFTANPVWGGTTSTWTIVANSDVAAGATGSNTLRLAAPAVSQTEYLSSQVSSWGTSQEWGFFLGRRAQALTGANQAYFWLYANEATLTSVTVDGYRIAIGDDAGDDNIRLEYIVNGAVSSTVITTTNAIANGRTDFGLLIRVTRSATGAWEIFTSTLPAANGAGAIATDIPNSTNASISQGTGTDNSLVPATDGYIGVAALHSTGANAIVSTEFDQVYFTPATGGTSATLSNLTPQPSGSITQGTTNAVLAGFSITPSASVDFTSITVTSTGTATSTDISNVRIFKDNDGNGAINGADAAVGGAAAQAYSASMAFAGITGETGLVAQTNYLVVADIAGVGISTPGNTTTVSSNTFTTTATSNTGSFTGNSRTIAAPPGATTITAGAGAEPATISSLINTQGAAVLNFDFTIQDDGATPATDAVASQISQIILNAGTGNTVTNWNTAIQGVELSDGTNSTTTATIGTSGITFTAISNAIGELGHIADDASKTYILKIWLKTNLGAFRTTIDGQNFVFRIQTADVTVAGSQLATGQDVNSGSSNNVVDVTATALAFVTQPSNTTVNQAMSNVTVSVNDANGNRDLGSTTSVDITSSGTLGGSPVTVAAISGLATFVGLTHTATGTGLTLNAERNGTLDWDVASNTFDITSLPIAAWDFTGPGNVATFAATTFDANLVSASGANDITRGAGAAASAGANSFRTTGFQNDPIATTNTDYFQVTLTAQPGYELSLSSVNARFAGTASYAVSPGVSNQFAYSLDGTNFTLIGSPSLIVGATGTLPTIDLTSIAALQNVAAGTTITIRYYASGQTTTGGWGFNSPSSGTNGLAFGGSVSSSSSPNLIAAPTTLSFATQPVGSNSTSQSFNLSGTNLTGAPGNITVTAPSTDFQVSNDNSSWGAGTTIAYASATLTATPVYVRFTPQGPGPKSGNVTLSGGGDATPPAVAVSGSGVINYYSKSSGNLTDIATWGTATDGTGTSPADFTTAGQTFTVTNRASVTLDADWTVSGAGSKVVVGDGTNANELVIPSGFALTGTADVVNNGTLTIQHTTLPAFGTFATGSTVSFEQPGTFVIPAITYYNLTAKNGTKTLASGTTTINGTLRVNAVTGFNGAASPFSTVNLAGDFHLEAGAAFEPNPTGETNRMTLVLTGSGTQSLFGGGSDFHLFRLQTLSTPTTSLTITLGGNLLLGNATSGGLNLLQAGHTLALGTNTLTIRGGGFINSSNVGLISNSGNGNLVIDKTSGAAPVGSIGFTTGTSVNNLTVNSAGTGNNNLAILTDLTVLNTLTLTNGRIVIAEGATISLTNTTVLSGSGFGASKHIVTTANATTGAKGFLRKVIDAPGSFTYPTGDGTNYLPVTVTPSSTNDIWVCAFSGITENGEPNGTAFTAAQKDDVVDAVWQVNRFFNTGDATLTTSWPASLEGATFSAFADNTIGIAHNNGTIWGTVAGTGDNVANTATRTGITTFSPFGVGQVGQILPVNFGTVKATQVAGGIKVDWTNLTELEVVNYRVERSADGRSFSPVAVVNARLNNGGKAEYSFVDVNPVNGVNYYRIRSLESTGKSKYSIIVKVDIRGGATQLVLYPNPSSDGSLSYQANNLVKGQYMIRVFNSIGQQVYSKALNHAGGSVSEAISIPSAKPGIYSLQLISSDNTFVKTFVVQ